MIFAAGKDDYETSPDVCSKLLAALPEQTRSHIRLQYYPDASHGWDSQGPHKNFYDHFAHGGKGGKVYYEPNRETAKDSQMKVVEFFARTLKPGS